MTKRRKLPVRYLILIALLVGLAAVAVMPMLALAADSKATTGRDNRGLPQVSISLTSKGIVAKPTALKGGDYFLTIKNSTSQPRGIEMIGVDRGGSATVRYTAVLKPGRSEAFRWYFAAGTTAFVRDIMSCSRDQMNCMLVRFGQMRKAILVK